ncbi:FxDxF family PEP-CTERM protein [Duganella sp. BuS-21]|uniref:FxDxF family PEP-CTERM protein n=1 Tax=Duganella sp. BuS-21 TaxID=2943848 RepID=UPI0035A6278B
MKSIHFAKAAVLVCMLSSLVGQAEELIVNGGFETGTVAGWSATSTQFTSYEGALNDNKNSQIVFGGGSGGKVWYVRNQNSYMNSVVSPISGYSLFNGFDGDAGVFSLKQGFALTGNIASADFKFSFAAESSYSGVQRQLDVNILSADGTTLLLNIYNYVLPYQISDWSVNNISLDLTSAFNTLGAGSYVLAFKETIPQNYTGPAIFALDNVSLNVTAVPEPATYAMLLAGLGLVGFAARRKQRA